MAVWVAVEQRAPHAGSARTGMVSELCLADMPDT